MKATLSEEYYRINWERFLERVPGNDYINLEGELQRAMKVYEQSGMPKEAMQIVEKMEAEKIAAKCKKLVYSELETIKNILAGKASFGMTTQRQEIEMRSEFRKRFEFNCLQLSDFRKKYNL